MKATPAQLKYLRNAAERGKGLFYLDNPGRRCTGEACLRRRWITGHGWAVAYSITDLGRQVLEEGEGDHG